MLHVDSDAGDLLSPGPHPGVAAVPLALDSEGVEGEDESLLYLPEKPMQILAVLGEVVDRISHQLAGSMERHVASSLDLDEIDVTRIEFVGGRCKVRCVEPSSEGDYRRMLHQQQQVVVDHSRDALLGEGAL